MPTLSCSHLEISSHLNQVTLRSYKNKECGVNNNVTSESVVYMYIG